jgi:signal transduction histidine kinase
MMNIYVFSSLLAIVVCVVLAFIVYFANRENSINKSFGMVSFLAGIWSAFPYMAAIAANDQIAARYDRVVYFAAIFVPPTFLHFVLNLINGKRTKNEKILLFMSYVFAGMFFALNTTTLMIFGVRRFAPNFFVIPGPAYGVFVLYFGVVCLYAFIKLLFAMRTERGAKRQQYKYIFAAFIFAYASGLMHFMPAYFGPFVELAPHDFLLIVFAAIVAFAILRHRLLDIEIVIKRTAVYSALAALIVGIYSLVIFVSQELFTSLIGLRWLLTLLGAVAIAIGFKPLETAFTNFTDKYFFRKKYEYFAALEQASSGITEARSTSEILAALYTTFSTILKASGPKVYLPEYFMKKNGQADLLFYWDPKELKFEAENINSDNSLYLAAMKYRGILSLAKIRGDNSLEDEFKKRMIELVIPCIFRGRLIALILLGGKLSEEAYSDEDLRLLKDMANHSAIALDHARTYEEISKDFDANQKKLYDTERLLARSEKIASMANLVQEYNHQVKTPLSIIRGRIETLFDKTRDEEYLKSMQALLLEQVDRANYIVESTLRLSRPHERQETELDMTKLIEEALHLFPPSGVSVVKELQPGLTIKGDREDLETVFINLFKNAVEAMPRGGELKITTYAGEENGSPLACATVADTGVGIPPENLEKIFEPFFSTSVTKGRGLGLSIVFRIVREHLGSIDIESQVGKGTKFILKFPAKS